MYMYITEISVSTCTHTPPSMCTWAVHTIHVHILYVYMLTTVHNGVLHKPLNTFQLIRPTAAQSRLHVHYKPMCIQSVHTDYK